MTHQCFGINRNLRRCGREVSGYFCADHARQPIIILFTLIFTVLAGGASIYSTFSDTTPSITGDYVLGDKIIRYVNSTDRKKVIDLNKLSVTDLIEPGGLDLSTYKISQSLALNRYSNGFDGALFLLIDKKLSGLKGKIEKDGYSNIEILILEFVDHIELLEDDQLEQALLVIVDENLNILYYEQLGRELARIDRVFLYPNKSKPTYIVTTDYSVDFGSYNGPTSRFIEVNEDGFFYIFKNTVMSSLKSQWLIYSEGFSKTILYKTCRPVFSDNEFTITYRLLKHENGSWSSESISEAGFWEDEGGVFDTKEFIGKFPGQGQRKKDGHFLSKNKRHPSKNKK